MALTEYIEESIFPEKVKIPATFAKRAIASVVDGIFIILSWFIMVQFTGSSAFGGMLNIIIVLLYYPLMEASKRQATLGKTGMNIKVTNLDGDRISIAQAFGRHLARVLSVSIIFIGFFMMLWNKNSQTLHDRISGTLVLKDIHR